MSDVDLFGDFPPGTVVCHVTNPSMTGTVTDQVPLKVGKKIKFYVKWGSAKTEMVSSQFLKKVETAPQDLSAFDELVQGNYGKIADLKNALLGYRLGGSLNDNIYSLNITNTHFYPYQFKPLFTFFESLNDSLLIADEVGLGKTIEAGLIWTELRMRQQAQRLLVVCPSQLCEKWAFELSEKFGVEADIVDANGLADFITKFCIGKLRSGALIVSLPSIRPPKNWERWPEDKINSHARASLSNLLQSESMRSDVFNLFILDEAHHIRNEETQSHKIVADLRSICESTLFLSATPIQTSNDNLFSLLHVLDPQNYPYRDSLATLITRNESLVGLIDQVASPDLDAGSFSKQLTKLEDSRYWSHANKNILTDLRQRNLSSDDLNKPKIKVDLIKQLNRLNPLSQILTRTMKRHVLTEGRVTRRANVLAIELTPVEREYYDAVTEEICKYCDRTASPAPLVVTGYQRMLSSSLPASLEYWASSKPLDEEARESIATEYDCSEDEDKSPLKSCLSALTESFDWHQLYRQDSKYKRLLNTINTQIQEIGSSRMIIFSFYKATLRYLEKRLRADGISCARIDGDIGREERYAQIDKFKNGDFDILLSSEVAAEGVDLQFVSTLVNYDLPWNPAKIEQRIGRIDRIGQKSPSIQIINFVYDNTIESRIYHRLLDRLHVFEKALGVTEVFLGDQIRNLTLDLFSKKLSAEEQEQRIDSARLAIEHENQILDEGKGQSMVYDLIRSELETARRLERYILDDDLLSFVKWFCDKGPGQSNLYKADDHSDYYKLVLSAEARALFQHFLNETESRLETTNFFANPNLKLRFVNKQGNERPGVERVTQNHPLIRFISHWREKEKQQAYPTAAVEYQPSIEDLDLFKEIPDGYYAYSAQFWEYRTKGMARRKAKLSFIAFNVDTGLKLENEQAEALITKASRTGRTLTIITPEIKRVVPEWANEADDLLTVAQGKYVEETRQEALREAEFKKQSLLGELERVKVKTEDVLQNSLDPDMPSYKGLYASWTNRYERKKQDIETRLAAIDLTTNEVLNDFRTVSMGVIRVRRQ